MPKIDLLFIAALLQNTEVYAEASCLSLSNKDREYVAGMLDLLRRHYDDRIEGMRIENRRQDENRLLNEKPLRCPEYKNYEKQPGRTF